MDECECIVKIQFSLSNLFYVKKEAAAIAYFRQPREEKKREAFVHSSLRVIWNDDESTKKTMMILSLFLVSIRGKTVKSRKARVCAYSNVRRELYSHYSPNISPELNFSSNLCH